MIAIEMPNTAKDMPVLGSRFSFTASDKKVAFFLGVTLPYPHTFFRMRATNMPGKAP